MSSLFLDPLLFAPLVGSLLIGILTSIFGVLVFVRRRALLGETLSHAAFPGVAVAALFATASPLLFLSATVISALLGHATIDWMKRRARLSEDSALTLVLVGFFGIGITIISLLQQSNASLLRLISTSLFGQIATLDNSGLLFIFVTALCLLILFLLFYKEFKVLSFDRELAKMMNMRRWDLLFSLLVAVTLALGIRLSGVLLVSALLIAPAASARKLTDKLIVMIFLSALFSMLATFSGTVLSFTVTRYSLPIGPTIVLIATLIVLLSVLFSPKRGLITSLFRRCAFRFQVMNENLLKALWKRREEKIAFDFSVIAKHLGLKRSQLSFALFFFYLRGWIGKEGELTTKGEKRGARIVRFHRLWETYLVDLGISKELVHPSAEQMEHILNADFEHELSRLLANPTSDPHQKPIPEELP